MKRDGRKSYVAWTSESTLARSATPCSSTRTAKRPSWSIRSATNWRDTFPLTAAARALTFSPVRSRGQIVTSGAHICRYRVTRTGGVDHHPELSACSLIVSGIRVGPHGDAVLTDQLIGHDRIRWARMSKRLAAVDQKAAGQCHDDGGASHPGKATARMSIGCEVIQSAVAVMARVTTAQGI
jgi:hypothetical protein